MLSIDCDETCLVSLFEVFSRIKKGLGTHSVVTLVKIISGCEAIIFHD